MFLSSYANSGLLAALSCTTAHNVTGDRYKFVQDTAANDQILTVTIARNKILIHLHYGVAPPVISLSVAFNCFGSRPFRYLYRRALIH